MNCLTDRDETAYDTAKHTVKIVIYYNKKAQLWLRNPRDATAFQIHPEEIHRNDDDDDFSFTSRSVFIMVTYRLKFGI